jgi:hypothetical protein
MKNHEWKAMGRVIYGSIEVMRRTVQSCRKICLFLLEECSFPAAVNWIEGEFNSILVVQVKPRS